VYLPGSADRWALNWQFHWPSGRTINHDYRWLLTWVAYKSGVTLQQAQADMNAVTSRIAAAYPSSNKGWGASVEPLQNDFLSPDRIRNCASPGCGGFCAAHHLPQYRKSVVGQGRAGKEKLQFAVPWEPPAGRFSPVSYRKLVLALLGGGLGSDSRGDCYTPFSVSCPSGYYPRKRISTWIFMS